MRRALAVLAVALVLPAAAAAHVVITPPFVEGGVEAGISLTIPNERPPHATVVVRAEMPPGIAIVSAAAPTGWKVTVDGAAVTWSGGRLEDRDELELTLQIRPDVQAGTYALAARQTYDDAATVPWNADLSVLPTTAAAASDHGPWPVIAGAGVAIIVVAASLLLLRHLRRRSLQV